jgi:hypothetical protein
METKLLKVGDVAELQTSETAVMTVRVHEARSMKELLNTPGDDDNRLHASMRKMDAVQFLVLVDPALGEPRNVIYAYQLKSGWIVCVDGEMPIEHVEFMELFRPKDSRCPN